MSPIWNPFGVAVVGEGHLTLLAYAYNSITQGTWVSTVRANQFLNFDTLNSTQTDADQIDYKAYLAAGTYTLRLLAETNASNGIMKIYIAGTLVATFDLYSAGMVWDYIATQTSIAIATSGLKDIAVKVDGKNGASSSYYIPFSAISLWRTG